MPKLFVTDLAVLAGPLAVDGVSPEPPSAAAAMVSNEALSDGVPFSRGSALSHSHVRATYLALKMRSLAPHTSLGADGGRAAHRSEWAMRTPR